MARDKESTKPLPPPVNSPKQAMRDALAPLTRDELGNPVPATEELDLGAAHRPEQEQPRGRMLRIRNAVGTVHEVPAAEVQDLLSRHPRWALVDVPAEVDEFEGDEFMQILRRYSEAKLREAVDRLGIDAPASASRSYLAARIFEEGGVEFMETLFPDEEG